jgi:hypothetical protein
MKTGAAAVRRELVEGHHERRERRRVSKSDRNAFETKLVRAALSRLATGGN